MLLSDQNKLAVTYRVESGCLGPQGARHIGLFCRFAERNMQGFAADCVTWKILERPHHSHAEMEFSLMGRSISADQAQRYFEVLGKDYWHFEREFLEFFLQLIERYMGRG